MSEVDMDATMTALRRQQMDALVQETALVLEHSLTLQSISKHWSKDCWDSQFTECKEDPPGDYAEVVLGREGGRRTSSDLEALAELAKKWLKVSLECEGGGGGGGGDANETASSVTHHEEAGYWPALVKRGIRYKRLLSLLFYLLDRGQKLNAR